MCWEIRQRLRHAVHDLTLVLDLALNEWGYIARYLVILIFPLHKEVVLLRPILVHASGFVKGCSAGWEILYSGIAYYLILDKFLH